MGLLVCLFALPVAAIADWELVFEDDFTSQGDPLAGWNTFGDVQASRKGRRGNALQLRGPGGNLPAYSGAVLRLGGGIRPDELVVVRARYRAGAQSDGRSGHLAFKLEFKDRAGQEIGVEELVAELSRDTARRWNEIEFTGRVPAGTASTDLAVVLVQVAGGSCEVLVDEVEAERRMPPTDFLEGVGGFEASDGGAVGWTAFNNVAATPVAEGRAIKAWGAFNEPYGGSGLKRMVALPAMRGGEEITATVRTMSPAGDSIQGTRNFAVLRLECVNDAGQTIAHKETRPLDPEQSPMTTGAWNKTTMTMAPPDGTVAVRYILAFIQPTTEAGSILFDQATLERSSASSNNLLENGDFETASTGIPGWATIGAAELGGDHVRSGTSAVRLRANPEGSGIERSAPGLSSGNIVRVEAWTLVPPGGSSGDDDVQVRLTWLDRNGRTRDTVTRPLERKNGEFIAGTWRPGTLELPVPRGAVEARVAMVMPGGGGADSREAWIDDVTMSPSARKGDVAGITVPIANSGFEGGVPDPQKWLVADGAWSHNQELQYYAPDAITVDRGRMVITTLDRPIGDRKYSSGHISTQGRHEQKYGRWEVRAKLPTSQGMWPAIWLLPVDGSWPPEIDIIELVGKEPDTVHHSYHWGPLRDGLNPWDLGQSAVNKTGGMDFRKKFHDFAVEWTPKGITWFVDGRPTHHHAANLPEVPMYLIINTAVGGFWPGSPGTRTRWPEKMEVDRVRIHRWVGEP